MKTNKQLSPDAVATTGAAGTPAVAAPAHAPIIPRNDTNFLYSMEALATQWGKTPAITLLWVTQGEFAGNVAAYRTFLTQRNATGSNRAALTQALRLLDKKITEAVKEVKVYIEKKYKTANAKAQFGRFGIVKASSSYSFPAERTKRLEAIPLMRAAITADGFDNEEYGKAFWTAMLADYTTAFNDAGLNDSSVSGKVATKNQLKKGLVKVSSAILLVLKANYPDTYTGVYREWGLKK